ncbi:G-type lectin S-receptor-like serine/threonine-protein kinase At1g11410 isoform X4 [Hevea brasiliensis]|uniref:G-type lectin S-receptor-like serine/threonine-protein kinase At1g11410 isoform X4 n=1 Tax=Hevea brasiliensis TaxID=3981 RepID=UPI0025F97CE9|nr:G-type lectin S-receptor-like serine/threonine-protein kinase At1g11410 isoform X4 [Hevea brasiliensis]
MDFPKLFLRSSLLVLHFAFSSSRDTITINQTLHDGDFLISRENNFALGFFSTGSSSFRYLGIWYHKVREQTVVWVANRDDPIYGSSGVLSIDLYGNLVLHGYHNQKAPVWTTNVSVEVTDYCVAQLLDTGNLILVRDKSKSTVWESFDHPTDTMLPGMKLGLNRRTGMGRFPVSWRSADDPGTGNFSLQINPKGSPQVFIYWGIKYIWRSIAWPLKSYADISNVSFVNNQNETYVVYSVSDASVILRVILDYSGLLKKLIWHEKDGKWNEFWSVPKSPCDPYGHCGTYGICDPEFLSRRFECDCLPGYEPKSPRDWHILKDASGGCVRKRLESTSLCGHGEGFVKVANVKVPDTSAAVWVSTNMSPRDCEKNCRRNCSCSAYASIDIAGKETGCLTWYGKLMDTVQNREEGYDIYVRVDAVELVRNKWSKRWLDTIGNAYYKETSVENQVEANKLGQGGFGAVYKGKLSNGKEVAVKRLLKDSGQGIDEFKNEVLLIAKLQHQNLVKLIGCCIQGEEPMLVYEYMPNKSLDSFLFNETGRSILDWRKRFDIIVGIARGILYIHQDSRLRIIHRDLKTSNILLDEEMNPKISDFGLARIFEGDQTHEKTNRIVGTFGYMSPEYVVFGKFSTKSDVFSFGIILLEIVAGKKNNSFCQEDSYPSMIGKIWHLWREERAWEIVDSLLKHSCSPDEVLRCIQVGLLCVQEDVMERPTMSAIVLMLNSEISLPSPKQPAFTFRKSSIISSSSLKPKEGFCSVDEETITEVVCR